MGSDTVESFGVYIPYALGGDIDAELAVLEPVCGGIGGDIGGEVDAEFGGEGSDDDGGSR